MFILVPSWESECVNVCVCVCFGREKDSDPLFFLFFLLFLSLSVFRSYIPIFLSCVFSFRAEVVHSTSDDDLTFNDVMSDPPLLFSSSFLLECIYYRLHLGDSTLGLSVAIHNFSFPGTNQFSLFFPYYCHCIKAFCFFSHSFFPSYLCIAVSLFGSFFF